MTVQPAIEYSEFRNPNFIAIKANRFIAINKLSNTNICVKKTFNFPFIINSKIIVVLQQY